MYRAVMFNDTESDAAFEEKITCDLEYDIRDLTYFYQNTQKSQNWDFYRILLSKVENIWA